VFGAIESLKGGDQYMPADENIMKRMDEAAAQAQAEFQQNLDNWSVKDLIDWWTKWYLKAGHKRLGRILISIGKLKPKKSEKKDRADFF
jgi:hypothetical protein